MINPYVWRLVYLRLGVRNPHVFGLDFLTFFWLEILTFGGYKSLRFGVVNSYVWVLDFLHLGVTDPYVCC